jgi:cytochrome c biogenesis protein CcmG/thiol:disulfide interchange protein DsbE
MRRGHVAAVSAVVVGLVVALLVVVLATRDPATTKQVKSPLVGKPAPAMRAGTIDGAAFDLDRYRGEWALVNFFATWCVPCRQEHPELVQLSEEGRVNVVSVVFQDDPGTVEEFFEQQGGDWPVVEDPTGKVTLGYGVAKIPESFIVAPDGTVVAKFRGVEAGAVTELIDRFS